MMLTATFVINPFASVVHYPRGRCRLIGIRPSWRNKRAYRCAIGDLVGGFQDALARQSIHITMLAVTSKIGPTPFDTSPAEGGEGQLCDDEMEIVAARVARRQRPAVRRSRERSLRGRAIAAEPPAVPGAPPTGPRRDASSPRLLATTEVVVAVVGVQLVRSAPRRVLSPRTHGSRFPEARGRYAAYVAVGFSGSQAERCAVGGRDEMALPTRLAAVHRVRPRRETSSSPGTLALSSAARDQPRAFAAYKCSSSAEYNSAQIPGVYQSHNLYQAISPLQPTSQRDRCFRYGIGAQHQVGARQPPAFRGMRSPASHLSASEKLPG